MYYVDTPFYLELNAYFIYKQALMAQLDAHSTGDQVSCLIPTRSSNILSWRLIIIWQTLPSADSDRQLSVSGVRKCTSTG